MHGLYNFTCFMGTDPSPHQVNLIGSYVLKRIIFYFDGDEAGQIAVHKYARSINDLAVIHNAIPPQGKDPGDLSDRESFLSPLANAKVLPDRSLS